MMNGRPHRALEPELRVLLACARPSVDENAVAACLRAPLRWEHLIALCARHAVLPLVQRQLDTRFAPLVPATAREPLGRAARAALARSVMLSEELRRSMAALRAGGVSALAYKGPALALQVHGDITLRTYRDLDILVTRRAFGRARELLGGLGYRAASLSGAQEEALLRSECDQALVHESSGAMIELHWAVTPPHFSFPLTTEELLARAVTIDLAGLPVAAPSREDLVLLLAMNAAKDLWSRLEPACLIAALLPAVDLERVRALARRLRSERMLLLGLEVARRLLDAAVPALPADPTRAALADEAEARLLDQAPPPPSLLDVARFRWRSREHWSDRARYGVLRALQPTTADAPALPRRFWPVAFALRPWRLARAALRNEAP
jgi:hypothetical protein